MTTGDVAAALVAVAVVTVAVPRRPVRGRVPPSIGRADGHRTGRFAPVVRRRRPRSPRARDVAAWCDDLARDLRGGATLRLALLTVVPSDGATAELTAPVRLGLDRALTVAEATARVLDPGPHLRLALAVIAASADTGGSAAAAIDRVAGTLRQRAADHDERRVHAAQARLSAHVMTAVPLLMLGLLVTTDDGVRAILGTPIGAACVMAGLLLNATGWLWMGRIVGARS